ncbi:MAG: lipid-A-disaccharide synthase [Bacteroidales bacterium]|nr:lipid-A-disaccharide synthase [Bacteroidales bacterium]
MRYYIIAGEASGDLHASNLVAEIKKKDKKAEFRGCGGDLMKAQGVDLLKHYRTMAFMGFVEVAVNLRKVLDNIAQCKKDIVEYQPDALILVDYPGFNLRIADFAHEKGFKVLYYISPQVWAWKRRRVKKIKKSVDKMIVIFPFEEAFYKEYGVDVTYVGNPLLDELSKSGPPNRSIFLRRNSLGEKREIIALLPGSRTQEVKRILPVMLKVVPHFPDYQFVIGGVSSLDKSLYKKIIGNTDVFLIENQTYELLQNSSAAIVTSGTVTLETALFTVPEVVCYKATGFSYLLAKWMIKVKFISLVNLVMDKEVLKELIQSDLTEKNIVTELERLLHDGKRQRQILEDYDELRDRLGNAGASEKAAEIVVNAARMKH